MKTLAAYVNGLWTYFRESTLYAIAMLLLGAYTASGLSYPSLPGIVPVISPELMFGLAVIGILMGVFLLVRNVLDLRLDRRYHAASRSEQDAMIARELGVPVELVRRARDDYGSASMTDSSAGERNAGSGAQ